MRHTDERLAKARKGQVLDIHYGRRMARAVRSVAATHPRRAWEIRVLLAQAEEARKQVRRLLARHRIEQRRAPVLRFRKGLQQEQGAGRAA